MKLGSWAKNLKDELDKIVFGCIWQNPQESTANTLLKLVKPDQRYPKTERFRNCFLKYYLDQFLYQIKSGHEPAFGPMTKTDGMTYRQ
jgi:hypothetical protein